MDTTITFTPAQLVAICAAVLTITALAEKVVAWIRKAQKPEKDQNKRLDEVDKKLERDKKVLDMHTEEIDELKHSTKTLQRGVYELLGNAIDGGNNHEAMQEARDGLKKDVFGQ